MAAKKAGSESRTFITKPKKSNKGVVSKKGSSKTKSSKLYKKPYNGQGR